MHSMWDPFIESSDHFFFFFILIASSEWADLVRVMSEYQGSLHITESLTMPHSGKTSICMYAEQ